MNIVERTDEEIRALADPLWRELLKYSNEGKYGEFVSKFARSLALAMNQVVVNHQFANSELARNLSEDFVVPMDVAQREVDAGEHMARLPVGHLVGELDELAVPNNFFRRWTHRKS